MDKHIVKTKLVERDEIFKLIALGQAVSLPILLIGPPGTGKTNTLLDYGKAYYPNHEDLMANSFILETDEGTRSGEIKGRMDLKRLVTENVFETISPIVDAEFVLINEIDKASAGLRNSLLGIMNEKVLFNGQKKVDCNWKVFCAAVNEIPKDEEGSPFWDRFVLKKKLDRISKAQMLKYYANQASGKTENTITLNVPTEAEINAVVIDPDKLAKFVDVCYAHLSDRTLSYLPRLIGAAHHVYGISLNKAMIKVCDLLLGFEKAKQLAKSIEPAEMVDLRSKVEMIATLDDYDQIINQISSIKASMEAAHAKGLITKADGGELISELKLMLSDNPVYTHNTASMSNADGSMMSTI